MRLKNKIIYIVLAILTVQIITFLTISKNKLIKEVGRNYQTFILEHKENSFNNISIISRLNPTQQQFKKYFIPFKEKKINLCQTIKDCDNLYDLDFFYYTFNIENKNPFWVNNVFEGEMAKEYGAKWNSKYIWILFKWILIEKKNTGIS